MMQLINQKEQSYAYYADGSPILVADQNNSKTRQKSPDNNRHQIITHGCKYAIYKDPYIQQQMFEILKERIFQISA